MPDFSWKPVLFIVVSMWVVIGLSLFTVWAVKPNNTIDLDKYNGAVFEEDGGVRVDCDSVLVFCDDEGA